MPIVDPFANFDPTPYQTAPQLPLQTMVVLSQQLSGRLPVAAPPHVQVAEKAMRITADEAREVMLIRLRESSAGALAADMALDNGMDGVCSLGRERLRLWNRYLRAGLDFLLKDPNLDFEHVRERAANAERLAIKLYPENLLELLGRSYPEQSQLTANLIALIDADDHVDEFGDLAGAELLPILRRCQVEYEAMVDRRADPRSRADLRTVRSLLARRIVGYSTMVLSMLDETQPQTLDVVETALYPMVSARPDRSSPTSEFEDLFGGDAPMSEPEPTPVVQP